MSHAEYVENFYNKTSTMVDTARYIVSKGSNDISLIDDFFGFENDLFSLALATGRIPVRPGAAQLMIDLQTHGVSQALVTGATRHHAAFVVENMLPDVFSAVITGDDVQRHKPDPHGYEIVTQMLRVDPAGCVALEDSLAGTVSASMADIAVIGVVDPGQPIMSSVLKGAGALGPCHMEEITVDLISRAFAQRCPISPGGVRAY